MTRLLKFLIVLSVLSFGMPWQASAQTSAGTLSGTVVDEKNSTIPNATVTVRNVRTNESRTVQTDGEGRYRLVNLPIGDYETAVEAGGSSCQM